MTTLLPSSTLRRCFELPTNKKFKKKIKLKVCWSIYQNSIDIQILFKSVLRESSRVLHLRNQVESDSVGLGLGLGLLRLAYRPIEQHCNRLKGCLTPFFVLCFDSEICYARF
jgi:hypothetical protein